MLEGRRCRKKIAYLGFGRVNHHASGSESDESSFVVACVREAPILGQSCLEFRRRLFFSRGRGGGPENFRYYLQGPGS